MDATGDADELADYEGQFDQAAFLTPEARAFTGAGLVLAGLLSTNLFQFLNFFLLDRNGGGPSPIVQYSAYAGPSGVLAAAGASLAWPVRRWTGSRGVQGLAVAAVVVGVVIALSVAAGFIATAASRADGV